MFLDGEAPDEFPFRFLSLPGRQMKRRQLRVGSRHFQVIQTEQLRPDFDDFLKGLLSSVLMTQSV